MNQRYNLDTISDIDFILNELEALVYVIDIKENSIVYCNKKYIEIHGDITEKDYLLERKKYLYKDKILKDKYNRLLKIQVGIEIPTEKELETKLSKLEHYDTLTSLPNKILLEKKVNELTAKQNNYKNFIAFIFIDLDHFKTINNTKGHMVGDKILIECSKRLSNAIKKDDILSRFGGDEFILLIDTKKNNESDAKSNIEKIAKRLLKVIKRPFFIEKTQYQISASIGISIFNQNFSFDELLRRADAATHNSKEKGRDIFSFFDPKLQKNIERKVIVLERLRESIRLNKIKIEYQKQVGINNKVIGVEALARWNDEELGFVSPNEFIPIAEESGLIIAFGLYLIKEITKVLKQWENDDIKKYWRISINVSLRQFERDDFEYFLEEVISNSKINPNLLRLEITESLLLKNSDRALEKIEYLKKLGLTISIDDFGTGYSSLAYLKKLKIDELKIDKSFIEDILTDKNDEAIVTAILGIGNKFGFEVIAEGVENLHVHKKLRELGCKYFQGYFFGKPMKKEKL